MPNSTRTGRLPDLVRQATESALRQTHTSIPGRVESYDPKTQLASVKPLIKRKLSDGRFQPMPVVTNVPVQFPSAGGGALTFPVKKGDTVLLIFAERAIDNWILAGGESRASDRRRHANTDGIAIPGIFPKGKGPAEKANEDVLLTYQGLEVRLHKDGQVASIKAPTIRLDGNVKVTGGVDIDENLLVGTNISAGGDIEDGTRSMQDIVDDYNAHTHVDSNSGTTSTPTPEMD